MYTTSGSMRCGAPMLYSLVAELLDYPEVPQVWYHIQSTRKRVCRYCRGDGMCCVASRHCRLCGHSWVLVSSRVQQSKASGSSPPWAPGQGSDSSLPASLGFLGGHREFQLLTRLLRQVAHRYASVVMRASCCECELFGYPGYNIIIISGVSSTHPPK